MSLFKTFFEIVLPVELEQSSDRVQFKYCNAKFKEMFDNNERFHEGVEKEVKRIAEHVNRIHPEYDYSVKIFNEEVAKKHTL